MNGKTLLILVVAHFFCLQGLSQQNQAPTYDWPVKTDQPNNTNHTGVVVGTPGEYRVPYSNGSSVFGYVVTGHRFHMGIDVANANYDTVYSIEPGCHQFQHEGGIGYNSRLLLNGRIYWHTQFLSTHQPGDTICYGDALGRTYTAGYAEHLHYQPHPANLANDTNFLLGRLPRFQDLDAPTIITNSSGKIFECYLNGHKKENNSLSLQLTNSVAVNGADRLLVYDKLDLVVGTRDSRVGMNGHGAGGNIGINQAHWKVLDIAGTDYSNGFDESISFTNYPLYASAGTVFGYYAATASPRYVLTSHPSQQPYDRYWNSRQRIGTTETWDLADVNLDARWQDEARFPDGGYDVVARIRDLDISGPDQGNTVHDTLKTLIDNFPPIISAVEITNVHPNSGVETDLYSAMWWWFGLNNELALGDGNQAYTTPNEGMLSAAVQEEDIQITITCSEPMADLQFTIVPDDNATVALPLFSYNNFQVDATQTVYTFTIPESWVSDVHAGIHRLHITGHDLAGNELWAFDPANSAMSYHASSIPHRQLNGAFGSEDGSWLNLNTADAMHAFAIGICPDRSSDCFTVDFAASVTTTLVNDPVVFTDFSLPGATSWSWSFGDGTTATQQNPSHAYSTPGVYTVELTASDGNETATETKQDYIVVTDVPMADFIGVPTLVEEGYFVDFQDASLGSATAWDWSFPGGTPATSNQQNPTVWYNSTIGSPYDVSLTITTLTGQQTETKQDYISVYPAEEAYTAYFAAPFGNLDIGEPFSFVPVVQGGTPPYNYQWDFGDGTSSQQQTNVHSYNSVGTYNALLVVTDVNGAVATHTEPVSVVNTFGFPSADFVGDQTAINDGDQVVFTPQVTGGTPPYSTEWYFISPSSGGTATPAFLLNVTGNSTNPITFTVNNGNSEPQVFDVQMIATDALGHTDIAYKSGYITIGGPSSTGTPVEITSMTVSGVGCVTDPNWATPTLDFTVNAIHPFKDADIVADNVNVTAPLDWVGWQLSIGGFPLQPDPSEDFQYWFRDQWKTSGLVDQFDIPLNSYGTSYSIPIHISDDHSFPLVRSYTLDVVAWDGNGYYLPNGSSYSGSTAQDSEWISATFDGVFVDAGPDTSICQGDSLMLGGINNNNNHSYTWQRLVGSSWVTFATSANPVIGSDMYDVGSNTYRIIGESPTGCTGKSTVTIEVIGPLVNLADNQTFCAGQGDLVNATANYPVGELQFQWMPATYLDSDTVLQPTATIPQTGISSYTLLVEHISGCLDTTEILTTALANTNPIALAGADIVTCPGKEITLHGNAANGLGQILFQWSDANGNIIQPFSTNPNLVITPSSTSIYLLEIEDIASCNSDIDQILVQVDPALSPSIQVVTNASNLCYGDSINVWVNVAGENPAYSFSWESGRSSQGYSELKPPGAFSDSVTVEDSEGCIATAAIGFDVPTELLTLNVAFSQLCLGESEALGDGQLVVGGTAPYTYQWSPAVTLDTPNVATPIASPLETTGYFLSVTDANGCQSLPASPSPADLIGVQSAAPSDLTVILPPEASCVNQQFCAEINGDGLTIDAPQFGSYYGFPWNDATTLFDFGDGSGLQAASCHTYTQPGQYTITAQVTNSCGTSTVTQTVVVNTPFNYSTANIDLCNSTVGSAQGASAVLLAASNAITAPDNQCPAGQLVEVDNGALVDFTAGYEVVLRPGFVAAAGQNFVARIENCIGTVVANNKTAAMETAVRELDANRPLDEPALTAYPSPVKDKLTIELTGTDNEPVIVGLQHTVTGAWYPILQRERYSRRLELDAQYLPAGVYLVTAKGSFGELHHRVVIVH